MDDYAFVEAGDYLESEIIPIYGLVIAEGRNQSDMTALWDSLEALFSHTVSQKYNHLAFSKISLSHASSCRIFPSWAFASAFSSGVMFISSSSSFSNPSTLKAS